MRERTIFFLLGFWAILGQVVLLRETLVIFFGNEITIGLFYAVWFAGIFTGALIGAAMSDKLRSPVSFLIAFLPIMILLVVSGAVILRLGRLIFDVPVGQYVPFFTMTKIHLCALFPLGLSVGFAFPAACRTASPKRSFEAWDRSGYAVGTVYVYESLGSLTAGLLHSFYLVIRFSVFPMLFLLGIATLMLILFSSEVKGSPWRLKTLAFPALVLALAIVAGLAGLHRSLETWTVQERWDSLTENMELLESIDSRYQNIAIAEQAGQYNLYLNGYYVESFPDPYNNAVIAHFVMNQHPDPRTVLVIGSGLTGLLGQLLLYKPERLDYVELDDVLISFLLKYIGQEEKGVLDSPVVNVIRGDGRHFVKKLAKEGESVRYDMIIVNLPEPSNALINRFYTNDFYLELSGILSPDGVVATALPFSENYIREEVLDYGKSIYNSLTAVFHDVIITPGIKIFFFASRSRGVITTDPALLESRYVKRGIESRYFSPYHFSMLLLPERVDFVQKAFRGALEVPENTDTNPIAYYFGCMLWDKFSGGNLSPMLRFVERLEFWHAIVALLLVFLVRIGLYRLRGDRYGRLRTFASLFSIFTTGMAGMSVSILLMFSFQNAVGYLYGNIGVLIALFMFGLATGGWLLRREIPGISKDDLMILLEAVILLFVLLLSLCLPHLQGFHQASSSIIIGVYSLLMFIGGTCTGAQFPLTSSIYIEETRRLGRGAGLIDALDHSGALIGAFVTGVLLVPVTGVVTTLLLIASLKVLGLLFWLYGKRLRV